MIITAIKIRKLENTGTKLIGLADLTFDDMFVLHEIKILSNKGEMFLAMPSRKTNKGFKDIVHPISAEPRNKIEEILYELYEVVLESENMILEFENTNRERKSLLEQCSNDFEIMMRF